MKIYGIEGERETPWTIVFRGSDWRATLRRKPGTGSWSWSLMVRLCRIEEPFQAHDDAIEAAKALTSAVERIGLSFPPRSRRHG